MAKHIISTESLKHQIAEGNIGSLSQLYDRYYSKLKLYGLQFSPKLSSLSIEDSIQELFLWIAKNHKKLASIDNLQVYLFSALKRNALKEIGAKNRRDHLKDRYLTSYGSDTVRASAEFQYIEAENRIEGTKYVTRLLNSLPPKQRDVLYLRNYLNMNFKEIGNVMKLSEQVVRNYNYRAIQNLRSQPPTKLKNL